MTNEFQEYIFEAYKPTTPYNMEIIQINAVRISDFVIICYDNNIFTTITTDGIIEYNQDELSDILNLGPKDILDLKYKLGWATLPIIHIQEGVE